jgi:glycosyltransferase involved in cell wall biosynthesis
VSSILHIVSSLEEGEAAAYLVWVVGGLAERGWRQRVCCLSSIKNAWADALLDRGIELKQLGRPAKRGLWTHWRLRTLLREQSPTIVHAWDATANLYGRVAARGQGPCRVVATVPNAPMQGIIQSLAESWLVRNADRFVQITTLSPQESAAGAVAIPPGVSPLPPTEHVPRETLLAELGFPPDAIVIGSAGDLRLSSRYKDAIWSLDLLRCIYDNACLIVAGRGPHEWRLRRFSRQVMGEGPIRFLSSTRELTRYLPLLFCYWSGRAVGGPQPTLLEAMSAGVPVIATDLPEHRNVVTEGQNGQLVAVGDRAGVARITKQWLEDSTLHAQLSRNAKQVVERYPLAAMVDRFDQLYRSLG